MERVGEVGAVVLTLPSTGVAGSVAPLRVANLTVREVQGRSACALGPQPDDGENPTAAHRGRRVRWVVQLGKGVLDRTRRIVGRIQGIPQRWNQKASVLQLDAGQPRISIHHLQDVRIKRQPHVGAIEVGDVVDHDLHLDGLATLDESAEEESSVIVALCACETGSPCEQSCSRSATMMAPGRIVVAHSAACGAEDSRPSSRGCSGFGSRSFSPKAMRGMGAVCCQHLQERPGGARTALFRPRLPRYSRQSLTATASRAMRPCRSSRPSAPGPGCPPPRPHSCSGVLTSQDADGGTGDML